MDVLSDDCFSENSDSSVASIPCDFILDVFFDDPKGSAKEHEKLVKFFNMVMGKDQPTSEEDCERLDAIGVQFTR